MYRTITLRLNHRFEEDKAKAARDDGGFRSSIQYVGRVWVRKKEDNKIRNSMAMYHKIRKAIPGLPGSMVQTACLMATESLKVTRFKIMPKKSPISCIRYTWRGASVYLESGYATIQALNCRVIATFKPSQAFRQVSRLEGYSARISRFDQEIQEFLP